MPSKPLEPTSSPDAAQAVAQAGQPVLLDFYATWCGPCRQVAPVVEAIAAEHPEYTVVKVDIDQAADFAQGFNVMGVPTLVVLNTDGSISSQVTGPRPKQALLEALSAAS